MNTKKYKKITIQILNSIKIGNFIKINDWDNFLEVKAISKNFIIIADENEYSIISKIPRIYENQGMFFCGPDNWIFGSTLSAEYENLYKFINEKANNLYLSELESGKTALSERNSVAIYHMVIKS